MPIMDRQDEYCPEPGSAPEGERSDTKGGLASRRRLISGGLSAGPVFLALQSKSALAFHVCQSPSGAMSGNLSHGNQLPETMCAGSTPDTWNDFQAANPSRPAWPGSIAEPALQIRSSNTTGNGYSHWLDVTAAITGGLNLIDFKWSGENVLQGKRRIRRLSGSSPEFGASFNDVIGNANGILVPVLPTPPSGTNDQRKAGLYDTLGSADPARPVSVLEVLYWPNDVSPGDAELGQLARYCVAAYFNALADPSNYAVLADQVRHMWYDIAVSKAGYCPLPQGQCSAPWGAAEAIDYLASTFA